MFNLLIYLCVIFILLFICNNITEPLNNNSNNNIINKNLKVKKQNIILPNPNTTFNYETVDEYPKEEPVLNRYYNELNRGASVNPQYTNNNFLDQKAIYGNELYENSINVDRTFNPLNSDGKPKTISQVYNELSTDFTKLTPKMKGVVGDIPVECASYQSTFTPNFINYDNEKPENGGKNLHTNLFNYDPLIDTSVASFEDNENNYINYKQIYNKKYI